jgi:Patatin-like phospholipase
MIRRREMAYRGTRRAGSPNYDSERAYFDALVALKEQGDPLTVVVDIIAGTSAGGINGVCLARGLAEGRSLNGFRNLWLERVRI